MVTIPLLKMNIWVVGTILQIRCLGTYSLSLCWCWVLKCNELLKYISGSQGYLLTEEWIVKFRKGQGQTRVSTLMGMMQRDLTVANHQGRNCTKWWWLSGFCTYHIELWTYLNSWHMIINSETFLLVSKYYSKLNHAWRSFT